MQTLLLVTGVTVWVLFGCLIVLGVALVVAKRMGLARRLRRASMIPYTTFLYYRIAGIVMLVLYRLKLMPAHKRAVVDAHRAITLQSTMELRDVVQEVDRLPTVAKGKAALGVQSIFEILPRRVARIPSPYTHKLQYPAYYIPGVPARTFYDPAEFEWVKPLEAAYPIIKEELTNVLHDSGRGFKAYVSEGNDRLAGWNTFNFFFFGKKIEENCSRCPRTTAVLESLPRFERDHIMFSALNPHSRIPPHTGPMNGIIRAHLGLVVPEGCYIRVGNDERTWREGKTLVFDDSFEHEVWNHSDTVRIVLFINFWHPCFAAQEIPVLERFRMAYERSPLSQVHEGNQAEKRGHDLIAPAPAMA